MGQGQGRSNPWDALAAVFSGEFSLEHLSPDAADNVCLAWPPLLTFLEEHVARGAEVLDFGCGGGWFAAELAHRGYRVTAMDASAAMIEQARRFCTSDVRFLVGDLDSASRSGPFAAVTSLMTLEFIADVGEAMRVLSAAVAPGGALALAVHNPEYVRAWARADSRYVGFDSVSGAQHGRLHFGEHGSVSMHVRTGDEYDALAHRFGLRPVLRLSPPFTPEFLRRFPPDPAAPTHISEYLILGYLR